MIGALDAVLRPGSVAVIGASRRTGSVGHEIVGNLERCGYSGRVYPVNPKADVICGRRAYANIAAVPERVDLAVIALPGDAVVGVAEACGAAGVRALVVVSAGFREVGGAGIEREAALLAVVRRHGMRLVGPNCLGVLNTDPAIRLNATFAPGMPPPGRVAFVSQSGALGLAVLDRAGGTGIGIAQFVSIGNRADVSSNDLLEQWEHDAGVGVILMYVESFGNPRRFLEVAGRVTRVKPVVILKAGRSAAGSRAAASHTGALAGSESAIDAMLDQAGVLRAESVEALLACGLAFSTQPLPRSRSVGVVTNAGGPGILAADALAELGCRLPALTPATGAALKAMLSDVATVGNPVDVVASAPPATYGAALSAVLGDPAIDAALAIFVPPVTVRQAEVAHAIAATAPDARGKPLLAVLMGHTDPADGRAELRRAGIPSYDFPETAARALAALARQREWMERPVAPCEALAVDSCAAERLIRPAGPAPMRELQGVQALALLQAYGIACVPARLARTPDEAVGIARELGYPVVLKVVSAGISHKTDVGGVRTDLRGPEEVRAAFGEILEHVGAARPEAEIGGMLVQRMVAGGRELIVGALRDPELGPLVMFGLGGVLANVLRDVVFRVAPIRRPDAADMLRGIRGARLLGPFRGEPAVALHALEDVLLRVSQLVVDFPEIAELDINPLRADANGATALDVRVVLRSALLTP